VLTRYAAIEVVSAVTRAPITRTIRGIRSEVEVGPEEGLPEASVVSCDNVLSLPKALLASDAIGYLGLAKRVELDLALRYALDIQY
jgi:mRNA interferase MazF